MVRSILLCLGYSLFLVFGALIFMYLEYEIKIEKRTRKEWHQLKGNLEVDEIFKIFVLDIIIIISQD